MLWLCFKLPSCLLAITRNTSVMHEKAKFVCFIYMQPQKVKFIFVQINMKQVSYSVDFIFLSFGIMGFSLWNFETIRGSRMKPKWQKLASLAQKICISWLQFLSAVFASKG